LDFNKLHLEHFVNLSDFAIVHAIMFGIGSTFGSSTKIALASGSFDWTVYKIEKKS